MSDSVFEDLKRMRQHRLSIGEVPPFTVVLNLNQRVKLRLELMLDSDIKEGDTILGMFVVFARE